ncbi:hypothetical protein HDE_01983 [Halotydeus destructor]|nr:hypothetical protein HDE_01983 [Halotydeus destructor]
MSAESSPRSVTVDSDHLEHLNRIRNTADRRPYLGQDGNQVCQPLVSSCIQHSSSYNNCTLTSSDKLSEPMYIQKSERNVISFASSQAATGITNGFDYQPADQGRTRWPYHHPKSRCLNYPFFAASVNDTTTSTGVTDGFRHNGQAHIQQVTSEANREQPLSFAMPKAQAERIVITSTAVAACATLSAPQGPAADGESAIAVPTMSTGPPLVPTLSFPSLDQTEGEEELVADRNSIVLEPLKTPPPRSLEVQTIMTTQNIAPAPPAPAMPLPVVPVEPEPKQSPPPPLPSKLVKMSHFRNSHETHSLPSPPLSGMMLKPNELHRSSSLPEAVLSLTSISPTTLSSLQPTCISLARPLTPVTDSMVSPVGLTLMNTHRALDSKEAIFSHSIPLTPPTPSLPLLSPTGGQIHVYSSVTMDTKRPDDQRLSHHHEHNQPLLLRNPGKPYMCDICGKQLASKNVYQLHLR